MFCTFLVNLFIYNYSNSRRRRLAIKDLINDISSRSANRPIPIIGMSLSPNKRAAIAKDSKDFDCPRLRPNACAIRVSGRNCGGTRKRFAMGTKRSSPTRLLVRHVPTAVAPSHRMLSFNRGTNLGVLSFTVIGAGCTTLS